MKRTDKNVKSNELGKRIAAMRSAYARGDNVMAWARDNIGDTHNSVFTTLMSYDLQAGTYVEEVRRCPIQAAKWSSQLADLLRPHLGQRDSILEIGVGEATTLSGVISALKDKELHPYGFDISWSRLHIGNKWLKESGASARLFVADLFNIPLADNSVDVLYTAHSLEPNGGFESEAIRELLRVARKAVVLVEPIYELASDEAKQRMLSHGYVRGLKQASEELGANIGDYGLLDVCTNPLNPSGVILLTKPSPSVPKIENFHKWQCPLTLTQLLEEEDVFMAADTGIVYPIVRGIPLLRNEHAVIASALKADYD